MASPEGLRLLFGPRLPKDVADIIFEFGFHLWLARPHRWAQKMGRRVRRSEWCEVWGVAKGDLSEQARKLVGFDEYWRTILRDNPIIYGWNVRVSPQGTFCKCGSAMNPGSCDQCQVFRPRNPS